VIDFHDFNNSKSPSKSVSTDTSYKSKLIEFPSSHNSPIYSNEEVGYWVDLLKEMTEQSQSQRLLPEKDDNGMVARKLVELGIV